MIRGLDHVAVAVRDFDAAVDGYRRLLGREPDLAPGDGAQRAWFGFPNMALEVIAPAGPGPAGDRLRTRLEADGEGLWLLAFQVEDLPGTMKRLSRRGLDVDAVTGGSAALAKAAGLQLAFRAGAAHAPSPAIDSADSAVASLDHVVIRTPNADRALAIYGAKLGLDLRLDRSSDAWGARQLFFKVGEAVLEFGASLKARVNDGPDSFGGLAWRVVDPVAAQARLGAAGFDVSDVRPGRKPGTHVFTVRDAPAGVPTLMLSAEPLPEPA